MRTEQTPAVPIHALLDGEGQPAPGSPLFPALRAADLVFGRDVTTGREFLVYGQARLEEIVRTRRAQRLGTVFVELDQDTDELETLCAMMLVLRGRCDYRGGGPG